MILHLAAAAAAGRDLKDLHCANSGLMLIQNRAPNPARDSPFKACY